MLFSSKKGGAGALDSIHNYYERLVLEVARQNDRCRSDANFLADVACVALNHLPPRYIRHDVDSTFFLSPQEQREIRDKVELAVRDAVQYVQRRDDARAAPQDSDG